MNLITGPSVETSQELECSQLALCHLGGMQDKPEGRRATNPKVFESQDPGSPASTDPGVCPRGLGWFLEFCSTLVVRDPHNAGGVCEDRSETSAQADVPWVHIPRIPLTASSSV